MKIRDLAIGAAVAGMLAGAGLVLPSTVHAEAKKGGTERNGCKGKHGCGSKGTHGSKKKDGKDKNGCNGPNGCSGKSKDKNKKERNSCSGPNGCGGKNKKH